MKYQLSFLLLLSALSLLAQESFDQDNFSDLSYRNVGPSRGGRVTAVAGIESEPSVFYMGATGGGVWKTEDRGAIWRNVSDGYFATGSIGAIRVYQNNPDIVYAGTGSDGIRSNVILGKVFTGPMMEQNPGGSWVLKKQGR